MQVTVMASKKGVHIKYVQNCQILHHNTIRRNTTISLIFMILHKLLTPACQEITCILWNLRIHYHVHNSPPLDSVLRQINPVYALPTNFFKFVLILSPHQCLGLPSSIFLPRFPTKSLCEPLPLHATCPAHPFLLDLIAYLMFVEE